MCTGGGRKIFGPHPHPHAPIFFGVTEKRTLYSKICTPQMTNGWPLSRIVKSTDYSVLRVPMFHGLDQSTFAFLELCSSKSISDCFDVNCNQIAVCNKKGERFSRKTSITVDLCSDLWPVLCFSWVDSSMDGVNPCRHLPFMLCASTAFSSMRNASTSYTVSASRVLYYILKWIRWRMPCDCDIL